MASHILSRVYIAITFDSTLISYINKKCQISAST
jgi:hypothetical protein